MRCSLYMVIWFIALGSFRLSSLTLTPSLDLGLAKNSDICRLLFQFGTMFVSAHLFLFLLVWTNYKQCIPTLCWPRSMPGRASGKSSSFLSSRPARLTHGLLLQRPEWWRSRSWNDILLTDILQQVPIHKEEYDNGDQCKDFDFWPQILVRLTRRFWSLRSQNRRISPLKSTLPRSLCGTRWRANKILRCVQAWS